MRGTSGSCVTSSSRESTEQKSSQNAATHSKAILLKVGGLRGHKNVSQKVLKNSE